MQDLRRELPLSLGLADYFHLHPDNGRGWK